MTFTPTIVNPSWAFQTNTALPGVDYAGGFYDFAGSDNNFSTPQNWGTANASYAAHFLIVTGAVPGTDTTIQVSGVSITDDGVRTPGDTQNIVIPASTAANTYLETPKKWLGTVVVTHLSGPLITCNYGWSKYHDVNNQDFTVIGLECLWIADNTDSTSDIIFRHHKSTGWTFNSAAPPTPPAAIASRSGDHSTDNNNVSGEQGAWKRANLDLMINGADSEGFLFEIHSANAAPGNLSFRTLTIQVSLRV